MGKVIQLPGTTKAKKVKKPKRQLGAFADGSMPRLLTSIPQTNLVQDKDLWNRICQHLIDRKILSGLDVTCLEATVHTIENFNNALKYEGDKEKHPTLQRLARWYERTARSMCRQFYLKFDDWANNRPKGGKNQGEITPEMG